MPLDEFVLGAALDISLAHAEDFHSHRSYTQSRQRDVRTPHFQHPFRLTGQNGSALVNEQDTEDDVMDCCELIVAYPIGSREDLPDFGCPDLVFKQASEKTSALISAALLQWEPRSETIVSEENDWDEMVQHLHVQVTTSGGEV